MPAPGERKTFQSRILAYAQEIDGGLRKQLGEKAEEAS